MHERPLEIPNAADWPRMALTSLCSVVSRGTAPVYVDGSEIRAIGQRCVAEGGFDARMARPHSARAMANVLVAGSGDVLLNSTGTGTIGRSCIFDGDGQFIVDGHVTMLRPSPGKLSSHWLNAMLRSAWGQRHLERFCYSGSTNQVELNRQPLLATCIPVPPIAEQEAFGEVLNTLDTTIRQTEAIIEKLKQVKQGLLHDLLTRGIDANGELRPPHSEAPHLYLKSELGDFPKVWSVVPAHSLCELITKGTTPAAEEMWQGEGGVRFLRVDNLTFDGRFDFLASNFRVAVTTHEGALARSRCRAGDVLTNIVGPPLGKLGLVDEQVGEVNINQAIAVFRPTPELSSKFLLIWLGSSLAQTWLRTRAKQTSGQVNLTLALCQELPIPAVSKCEQLQIVDRFEALQRHLDSEQITLSKLHQTKSGLMDDLLTGRVCVTPLLNSDAVIA